ncbi:hypothetical protein [Dyella sp.]|uniref:hypothetical protein n=1 Tax=Dyella sp. TaxID=1869338 RepID=UPI00283B470E|nr:hypothetical protein [Dyella sp.]MDR3444137.1 hypothetical protein [Dyella sp.]
MTQEELEKLTREYLAKSFDEIEDRLALDWTPEGFEIYSSQLNERCHALSDALASADLAEALPEAQGMAPEADELFHRKLARRLIEVQLQTSIAEMRAISGESLVRPQGAVRASSAPSANAGKATPGVSQIAEMYAEERVSRGSWSARTASQGRKIFTLIAELLGDKPVGDVSKDDVRRLGLDIVKLPANMTQRYRGLSVPQSDIAYEGRHCALVDFLLFAVSLSPLPLSSTQPLLSEANELVNALTCWDDRWVEHAVIRFGRLHCWRHT